MTQFDLYADEGLQQCWQQTVEFHRGIGRDQADAFLGGVGNRLMIDIVAKIGDVTTDLNHSIEGQPILVDAWTALVGETPAPERRMPIPLGRATLDLGTAWRPGCGGRGG